MKMNLFRRCLIILLNIKRKGIGIAYWYELYSEVRSFLLWENLWLGDLWKKSMLAMMMWVIITLVEANTDDHTATPNDLVEPDYIAEVKYINCLIYAFESCQNYYKESNNLPAWLEENALTIFDICTREHNLLVKRTKWASALFGQIN